MRQRSIFLALAIVSAVLGAVGACSDQSEGQRCDPSNNSDDCTSPNICVRNLPSLPAGSAICCPPPGQPVTVAACNAENGLSSLGTGGTASTDAGPDATSAPDASKKDSGR